jgi:hypothetical protein
VRLETIAKKICITFTLAKNLYNNREGGNTKKKKSQEKPTNVEISKQISIPGIDTSKYY